MDTTKGCTLLFVVLAFLQIVCFAQNVPTFPNIGYLGAGYDFMYGNPHTTVATEAPDPGYRQWVYNLTIYTGAETPDQRYRIPQGIQVSLCDACSIDFTTQSISGSQSYQHDLDDSISASVGFFGAHFSASYDYKQVQEYSSNYSSVFTESIAECCVYKGSLETFDGPPLSQDFIDGVGQMPTVYNSNTASFFALFISAFGTHYTSAVTMGGRFGQRSRISSSAWSKLSSSDLTITVAAGFSAQSFSAAVSVMSQNEIEQAKAFSQMTESQSLFAVGGELPSDGKVTTWITTSKEDPMPLAATIHLLTNVVNSIYFPNDPNIVAKQTALTQALQAYCPALVSQGVISSCTPPPPDPPLPLPSIFGGMYQMDQCGKDNINNIYTSAMACKEGYSPSKVGLSLAPDSGCPASLFLCLLDGAKSDPALYFGGMFQAEGLDVDPTMYDQVNPLTGALSCPAGFSEVEIGRVTVDVHQYSVEGSTQYGCYNYSVTLGNTTSGGGYQKVDHGGSDNVVNYYTQAVSCPVGFQAYQIGRVTAPDSQNLYGADQYICLNNVFLNGGNTTTEDHRWKNDDVLLGN